MNINLNGVKRIIVNDIVHHCDEQTKNDLNNKITSIDNKVENLNNECNDFSTEIEFIAFFSMLTDEEKIFYRNYLYAQQLQEEYAKDVKNFIEKQNSYSSEYEDRIEKLRIGHEQFMQEHDKYEYFYECMKELFYSHYKCYSQPTQQRREEIYKIIKKLLDLPSTIDIQSFVKKFFMSVLAN